MKKGTGKETACSIEMESLRKRLEEAEEMIRAIRSGEIDALVVSTPEGEQVFTLKGAEHPYRVFVEAMNEGAVTLGIDGTILYCNKRFSDVVKTSAEKVIGSQINDFIMPADRPGFESTLKTGSQPYGRVELVLRAQDGSSVPVCVSFNPLKDDEGHAICIVITDLTEHKQAERALRESEKQLRALSAELLKAQENERKRIAQELHDGLQQVLTAIKFKVESFLQGTDENAGILDVQPLRSIIPIIQESVREINRIQTNLRPPVIDDLGVLAAVSWLSRRFEEMYSNIRIERRIEIREEDIPDSLKMVIYRVLQEALNNVVKHSHADRVDIAFQKSDTRIELVVRDNGRGFDVGETLSRGHRIGLGLVGMRERAENSGGVLKLQSAPGKGTHVKVAWPLSSRDASARTKSVDLIS